MSRKLPELIRTRRPGQDGTPPQGEHVEPADSVEGPEISAEEPTGSSENLPVVSPLPVAHPTGATRIERRRQAQEIVATHAAWSSAFGLMPIPFADVAGISGTQLRMLAALSRHYRVPFSRHWGLSILGSVAGGAVPWATAQGLVSTLFKSMPGVGLGVGLASMAALSNLSTRVLGRLFIEHFEAGGSLADVDSEQMRRVLLSELNSVGKPQ